MTAGRGRGRGFSSPASTAPGWPGSKADTFFLRQHPKTLSLPFRADLGRPNRDNVIDGYINGNEEDVCADGIWQNYFTRSARPADRRRQAGIPVQI